MRETGAAHGGAVGEGISGWGGARVGRVPTCARGWEPVKASRGRERGSEAEGGAAKTRAILGRGTRENTTLTGVLGLPSEMTEREAGKRRSGSSVVSAKA